MRCPKCGGYSFNSDDRCLFCGHSVRATPKPPSWWGTKDWHKPAKPSESKGEADETSRLERCPECGEKSLFYNTHTQLWECLSTKCKRKFTRDEIAEEEKQAVTLKKSSVSREKPVATDTGETEHYQTRAKRRDKKTRRRMNTGRWILALVGVFFLAGGIIYFPSFQNLLGGIGIQNEAFLRSLELPFEVFGGFLLFIAIFAKRRAKGVKVSVFLLLLVLSGLFVWHTPSLKSQVSDTMNSWRQRVFLTSQRTTPTPTPPITPRLTQTPTPVWGTVPTPVRTQTPTAVPAPEPSPTPKATPAPTPTPTPAPTPTPTPAPTLQELAQYMLDLINQDRIENGLTPVTLGNNTAAQKHAEEMLANGYLSHWGLDGMKPYMRYTLAGGFNYEAENGSAADYFVDEKGPYVRHDIKVRLDRAQKGFMSSPDHRENILNKRHKKVNIGLAYNSVTESIVQQFEGDYIRFNKLPTLTNGFLSLSGETLSGFMVDQIQIWYDPLPHPLTLGQLGATYAYNLGKPGAFIRPPPPPGSYYTSSETQLTWITYGKDPYSVPPDTPPPAPIASPFVVRIKPVYPPMFNLAKVKWVDAKRWAVSGSSFTINADLSETLSEFGKGVYTIVIWAKIGSESVHLTNYSIFVQ